MAPSPLTASSLARAKDDVRKLLNNDLRAICRAEFCPVSGTKAILQSRVNELLNKTFSRGDFVGYNRLIYRISNRGASPSPDFISAGEINRQSTNFINTSATHGSMPIAPDQLNTLTLLSSFAPPPIEPPSTNTHTLPPLDSPHQTIHPYRPVQPATAASIPVNAVWSEYHLDFVPSPFYIMLEPLTSLAELPVPADQMQRVVSSTLCLSTSLINRIRMGGLRIFLFCTTFPPTTVKNGTPSPANPTLIAFPSYVEVRVNGEEVRFNSRGVKNRPGTTNPADLTNHVRLINDYHNILDIAYSKTVKKHLYQIFLVRKIPVPELVRLIQSRPAISKDSVLKQFASKKYDAEVEATSVVMSLRDPLSMVRISLPCRTKNCRHNQCFDAYSFLQLQKQAPTWTCPICSKPVIFEHLAVDEYFAEILQCTSRTIDQVNIESNGAWSVRDISEESNGGGRGEQNSQVYKEYDVINLEEVGKSENGNGIIKAGNSLTPHGMLPTPSSPVREPGTTEVERGNISRCGGSSSLKRTREVIDLTFLSDDEVNDVNEYSASNNGNGHVGGGSRTVGSRTSGSAKSGIEPAAKRHQAQGIDYG